MQLLIRRYVTVEQKKLEEFTVTEDDIAEVRHDISSLRFELIDVFRQNNFIVPKEKREGQGKSHDVILCIDVTYQHEYMNADLLASRSQMEALLLPNFWPLEGFTRIFQPQL